MVDNKKLPYKITEYITNHFREDFLFELKEMKQVEGQWYYTVEVTKDDYIHTLRFNEDGVLVREEEDEAFPTDMHEETGFDNLP